MRENVNLTKHLQYNVERFPGQRENEVVKLIVKKHWIIYVRLLREFIIFALVPFLSALFFTGDTTMGVRYFVYFFSLIYLSYFFLVIFIRWLDEMLDLIIVTNERVINIEHVNFFQSSSSETNLDMIQDVKAEKKGLLGNLMHYGMLEVQTAGEKIAFEIQDVAAPYTMSKRILDLRDEAIEKHNIRN